MTFHQFGAMLLLFQNCRDQALIDKVVKLVPELDEWRPAPLPPNLPRWIMIATVAGEKVGTNIVDCEEQELSNQEALFRHDFDDALPIEIAVRRVY